jgi:hypothetical protein
MPLGEFKNMFSGLFSSFDEDIHTALSQIVTDQDQVLLCLTYFHEIILQVGDFVLFSFYKQNDRAV